MKPALSALIFCYVFKHSQSLQSLVVDLQTVLYTKRGFIFTICVSIQIFTHLASVLH
jgi:hypothetical protein